MKYEHKVTNQTQLSKEQKENIDFLKWCHEEV